MASTASALYVSFSPSLPPLDTHHLQSDNYWLNTRTPALTYGLRGIAYYSIHVSGPARDLHSGTFGRTVHEPMTDLIALMSKLIDREGNILIPGVDDMVSAADAEERCVARSLTSSIVTMRCKSSKSVSTQSKLLKSPLALSRADHLNCHSQENIRDS